MWYFFCCPYWKRPAPGNGERVLVLGPCARTSQPRASWAIINCVGLQEKLGWTILPPALTDCIKIKKSWKASSCQAYLNSPSFHVEFSLDRSWAERWWQHSRLINSFLVTHCNMWWFDVMCVWCYSSWKLIFQIDAGKWVEGLGLEKCNCPNDKSQGFRRSFLFKDCTFKNCWNSITS